MDLIQKKLGQKQKEKKNNTIRENNKLYEF